MVAVLEQSAFVKVIGRANVASSVKFKTLVSELRDRGITNFVLDLGECATMDSTFLGVLAGLVVKLADGQESARPVSMELLNPNARVSDLLENLGVVHLFKIITGANPVEAALQPTTEDASSPSKTEISKTCLEAHQLLMALNPENIPKFKDVTLFLAEDLKKLSSSSTA